MDAQISGQEWRSPKSRFDRVARLSGICGECVLNCDRLFPIVVRCPCDRNDG